MEEILKVSLSERDPEFWIKINLSLEKRKEAEGVCVGSVKSAHDNSHMEPKDLITISYNAFF